LFFENHGQEVRKDSNSKPKLESPVQTTRVVRVLSAALLASSRISHVLIAIAGVPTRRFALSVLVTVVIR